ncbi:PLAC8-domain-containing protein [Patellaria atrata CBS 101060]|uniref:PLAC8-domain-containing protein n=1 Tax=Patellaria atrata CBS 101060 TaxID=1346257 RepID=A0A9P4S387_9PEZI|nr:PLAC8-domain-containing protein [Patellaria atrata CBS 101060]
MDSYGPRHADGQRYRPRDTARNNPRFSWQSPREEDSKSHPRNSSHKHLVSHQANGQWRDPAIELQQSPPSHRQSSLSTNHPSTDVQRSDETRSYNTHQTHSQHQPHNTRYSSISQYNGEPPVPPSQSHPAISAPYDPHTAFQQPDIKLKQDHDDRPPIPPLSPGPVPMKSETDRTATRFSVSKSPPAPFSPTHISSPNPIFSPNASTGPNGLPLENHKPGQIAHPNMDMSSPGSRSGWKHSLCSCDDVGTCVTGIFCPCIIYGKTAYRLGQRREKKDPTDLLGWKATNGQCGLMAAACGFWCLFPLIHRTRIRHLYKIEGSVGSDILNACCCCCCATIQNELEVRDREDSVRRWAGPATGAYTSPEQMVYAPPPRS